MLGAGVGLLAVKFLPRGPVHVDNRRSISSITACSKHISCEREKSKEKREKTSEKGKRKYSD